jgi:hypothetical protein
MEELLYHDIEEKIVAQVKRLLRYIDASMKGIPIEIICNKGIGPKTSCTTNFIPNEQVKVNIYYSIDYDSDEENDIIKIIVYSMFGKEPYEISVSTYSDQPLFRFVPASILSGLKRCYEEEESIMVIL